jgi:acyl-coenzyme A synthetase/AMP-(fatty) acid ligase
MIPKRWRRVTELPMTAMGKPDRAEAASTFN